MVITVETTGCAWTLTWAIEELVGIVQTTRIVVSVAHIIVVVIMMVGGLVALSGPMQSSLMFDILVTSVEESPHGPDSVSFTTAITLVDLVVSVVIRARIVLIGRATVQALILFVHSVLVSLITLFSVTPRCSSVGSVGHPALSGTSSFSISLFLRLFFDVIIGLRACVSFDLSVRVIVSCGAGFGIRVIIDVSYGITADGRF